MRVFKSNYTECGWWYADLDHTGCPSCNKGGHYHYQSGACDLEPCSRHGGPR